MEKGQSLNELPSEYVPRDSENNSSSIPTDEDNPKEWSSDLMV
jgi:hypothetical protein